MDPFSFKAGLEQQAADEFVTVAHAPIFRTLGRSSRRMVWNLIRAVQIVIRMLVSGLRQMDTAARQQRADNPARNLIDKRQA